MPLFKIEQETVELVRAKDFRKEKDLQVLVERNLGAIFNCRVVASEFSTGAKHAGRIDTLALSEDNNPVIIEYKKVESATLINQSLFYLSWLQDHHGDFEVAAQKTQGKAVEIDWSDIRVLCIAPTFTKYDLHAVQTLGGSIELWTYRRYSNDTLFLDELTADGTTSGGSNVKSPVMVAAGKKAALTKQQGGWSFQGHLEHRPKPIQELLCAVQDFMTSLGPSVEEAPKKLYIAYRTTQNIVCVEPQQQKILLFVKLDPKECPGPPGLSRDVSEIGHFGTGDLEITIKTLDDLERAKSVLKEAYEKAGG